MKDFRLTLACSRKTHPRQGGIILITTMLILFVLFLIVSAFVQTNLSSLKAARVSGEDEGAMQACNTGLEYVRMRLEAMAFTYNWGYRLTGAGCTGAPNGMTTPCFQIGRKAPGPVMFTSSDGYTFPGGNFFVYENAADAAASVTLPWGGTASVARGEVRGWIRGVNGGTTLSFRLQFPDTATTGTASVLATKYYSWNNLFNASATPQASSTYLPKSIPYTSIYLVIEGEYNVGQFTRRRKTVEALMTTRQVVDSSALAGGSVVVAGRDATSTWYVNSASPFFNNVRAGGEAGGGKIYTPPVVYSSGGSPAGSSSSAKWTFRTSAIGPNSWYPSERLGVLSTPSGGSNYVYTGYQYNSAGTALDPESSFNVQPSGLTQYKLKAENLTYSNTSVDVDSIVSGNVVPNSGDPVRTPDVNPSSLPTNGGTTYCLPPGRYVFVDDKSVDYYKPGNTTTTPDNNLFGVSSGSIRDNLPMFDCSSGTASARNVELKNFLFQVNENVIVGRGLAGAPSTYTYGAATLSSGDNGFALDVTRALATAANPTHPTLALSYTTGSLPGTPSNVTFTVAGGTTSSSGINGNCGACTKVADGQYQTPYAGSTFVNGSLLGAGTIKSLDGGTPTYGNASFTGQSILSTDPTKGVAVYADGDVKFNPVDAPNLGQNDLRSYATTMANQGWATYNGWDGLNDPSKKTAALNLLPRNIGTFIYDPTLNTVTVTFSAVPGAGAASGLNVSSSQTFTLPVGWQIKTADSTGATFDSSGGAYTFCPVGPCSGTMTLNLLARVETALGKNDNKWINPSQKADSNVRDEAKKAIDGFWNSTETMSGQVANQTNLDVTVKLSEFMTGTAEASGTKQDNDGNVLSAGDWASYNGSFTTTWVLVSPVGKSPNDQKFLGVIYSKKSLTADPNNWQFQVQGALVAKNNIMIYDANKTVFIYDPNYLSIFNNVGGLGPLRIVLWNVIR